MAAFGFAIAGIAAGLSLLLALLVRRLAGALKLIATPNARSSHTRPTPTGGGIAIALVGTLAGLPAGLLLGVTGTVLLAAALLLALVGLWDDRTPVPARYRLMLQLVLAGLVISALPLPPIPVPETLVFFVVVLGAGLWINLFNFMDGIDGLAAGETVFVLGGAVLIILLGNPGLVGNPLVWWMLGVGGAALGFLVLNWPPAKLFMGDAGSTYLGLMIATFALMSMAANWITGWQWLILVAAFVADSMATLVRRIIRGAPVWQAHKEHAYQSLQRRFGSHRTATAIYLSVDVVLLLPLALAAGWFPWLGWVFALVGYALLVPAVLAAGAGAPLQQDRHEEGASDDDGQRGG